MSTPPNQQAQKEKKPTPGQNQTTPKGRTTPAKSAATPAKQTQGTARPAQNTAKPSQAPAKTTSQSLPKAGAAATPKATPPAPKPRDPSVARRDERREARRLEIQARQQERRQELRQAKRQKLLIRYDLIIAPIMLIGLVAILLVLHQPIGALIAGILILFAGFTVLAYATLMPTRTSRLARSKAPTLPEASVVESTLDEGAQPPTSATSDTVAEEKSSD